MRGINNIPVAFLATLLLLAASIASTPPPSYATDAPIVSDIWLPIAGPVFYPPSPCMAGGEAVELSGMVHILTIVDMATDYAMIFINLADVKGMGLISDMTYLAVGAFKTGVAVTLGLGPTQAPDPTAVEAAFDLVQAGACPTILGGAPVFGTLSFNSDGTLNADESSLSFGSPTT
jgi:hypothetical protein